MGEVKKVLKRCADCNGFFWQTTQRYQSGAEGIEEQVESPICRLCASQEGFPLGEKLIASKDSFRRGRRVQAVAGGRRQRCVMYQ